MNRGTIFIALFVIIAAGVIGASQFLQNRPPVEITIGADPLIDSWLRDVVMDFNRADNRLADGRSVQVTLQVEKDIAVWRDRRWTSQTHPDAWIPSTSTSVAYAQAANVPFLTVVDSVAKTPLIFGAFESRADILSENPLDWDDVQSAAQAESWEALGGDPSWRFVNLAFPFPTETTVGLGTLFSAVASFNETETLSAGDLQASATRNWLQPVVRSVPNFSNVGLDSAAFMSRSTASVVDVAMATESQWLSNLAGLTRGETILLSYPEYLFMFDFPVSRWEDTTTTPEKRDAVDVFANWLTTSAPQSKLLNYGLRPIDGVVPENATLFSQGEALGIMLDLSSAKIVQAPQRSSDVQSLLTWFNTASR